MTTAPRDEIDDDADRLPGRGIGWLRCHREGAQLWIEPLADRPGDVTSACVRRRRLAATAAHRELAAYWDGHRTPDNGPRPTAASAALVAALCMLSLLALPPCASRPMGGRDCAPVPLIIVFWHTSTTCVSNHVDACCDDVRPSHVVSKNMTLGTSILSAKHVGPLGVGSANKVSVTRRFAAGSRTGSMRPRRRSRSMASRASGVQFAFL